MDKQIIAIYKHGSRVKGYAAQNSDTDVAVVVENKSKVDQLALMSKVSDLLKFKNPDVRVVDTFSSPVFLFNVVKDGRLLYARSAIDKINFESKAMMTYYDTQYMRDIYRSYLYPSLKAKTYAHK